MKSKVKGILANIVYWLYENNLLKNEIKVQDMEDTIEELIHTEKSLVRFGDGEIVVLQGKDIVFQQSSAEIAEGLKRIISYSHDNLIVALPQIFEGVEQYKPPSRQFWKEHLLGGRKVYRKYCNKNKVYGNAFFSRFYYAYADKEKCRQWISQIKLLWKDKNIVIVEGVTSHNGAGNDLFAGAKSIERIICPAKNAMACYDEIIMACKAYPRDSLFLLSVGITAKFLAEELYLSGYRVIDIGNLDMEYEWYLQKTDRKVKIDKYSCVSTKDNEKAGYLEYLGQINIRIEDRRDDKIH